MHRKSFTLIELLVVMVIIGILAGVIMISTSSSIDKASIAKAKVFDESTKNNLMLDLVSEWDFNDSSHPYYDSWGDNNGSCTSCPIYLSSNECIRGGCAYFELDNSYIVLSRTFKLENNSGTLSFWYKKINNVNSAIFAKDANNYYSFLRFSSEGTLGGETDTNSLYLPNYAAPANDQKWHNYVLILGSENSKLYVDGVAGSDQAILGNTVTLNSIGASSVTAYAEYLKGYIDEIKFYNKPLSEAQIKNNYLADLKIIFASKKLSREDYNEKVNNLSYEK